MNFRESLHIQDKTLQANKAIKKFLNFWENNKDRFAGQWNGMEWKTKRWKS